MGTELFGVDIAGIVADNIGDGVLDVVITRYTAGTRTPGNLTGGLNRSPATVTGIKGFWEDFATQFSAPPGVALEVNDRKAVLIGDTIPAGGMPLRNDAITIDGQTLYMAQPIAVDPARAVYEFLCRDRRGADGA